MLALLAIASPADAQPSLKDQIALGTYAAGVSLDLHSTHHFLTQTDLYEANPLGRWIDHKPTALVVVAGAGDAAATAYLYHRLRHRPALRRVLLYSAAGVRFALAARNYRNVQRWRDTQ